MLENSQDSCSNYRKKFSFSNSKSPKSNLDQKENSNIKIPFSTNENEHKQAFSENKPFEPNDSSTKISIYLDEHVKLLLAHKENENGSKAIFETDALDNYKPNDINQLQSKDRNVFCIHETKKMRNQELVEFNEIKRNFAAAAQMNENKINFSDYAAAEHEEEIKDKKSSCLKNQIDVNANAIAEASSIMEVADLESSGNQQTIKAIDKSIKEYFFHSADEITEEPIRCGNIENNLEKKMEKNRNNFENGDGCWINMEEDFGKGKNLSIDKTLCNEFVFDYKKKENEIPQNDKSNSLRKNGYLDINGEYNDIIKNNNNLAKQYLNDNEFLNNENKSNAYINNNENFKTNNSKPLICFIDNHKSKEIENLSSLPIGYTKDKSKNEFYLAENINDNESSLLNKLLMDSYHPEKLKNVYNDYKIKDKNDVLGNFEPEKNSNFNFNQNLNFIKNEDIISTDQSNYNNLTNFLNKINESDTSSINNNNDFLPIKNQKLLFTKENEKNSELNNLINSDINKNISNNNYNKYSMHAQNNLNQNSKIDLTDINNVAAINIPTTNLENINLMLQVIKSINNNINMNVVSKLINLSKQQNFNLKDSNSNPFLFGAYSGPNPSTPVLSDKRNFDFASQMQNLISKFNVNNDSAQNDFSNNNNYIYNIIINSALMNSNQNLTLNSFNRIPLNQESNLLKNLKDLQFLISKSTRINTENQNPNCINAVNLGYNAAAEAEKGTVKPQEKSHSDNFLFYSNKTHNQNLIIDSNNSNNNCKNSNSSINLNYLKGCENGYFSLIPGHLNDNNCNNNNNNTSKSFSFADEFFFSNSNNLNNNNIYNSNKHEKEKNKLSDNHANLQNSNFLNDNAINFQTYLGQFNNYSNDDNRSNFIFNSSKNLLDDFNSGFSNKSNLNSKDDYFDYSKSDLNIINGKSKNKIYNKTNEKNGKKNVARINKNSNFKADDSPVNYKKNSKIIIKEIELNIQKKVVLTKEKVNNSKEDSTPQSQIILIDCGNTNILENEEGKENFNEKNDVNSGSNNAKSSSEVNLLNQKRGRESNLKTKQHNNNNNLMQNPSTKRRKNNVLFSNENPDFNNLQTSNFYNFGTKNASNCSSEKNSETSNKSDTGPVMMRNANLTQNFLKNAGETAVIDLREFNSDEDISNKIETAKALLVSSFSGKAKRSKPEKKEIGFAYYIDEEKNKKLKQQIQEFNKIYPEELEKILEKDSHKFMFNHFPEMYKKIDNFFINIINLNRKRQLNNKKTCAEIEPIQKFAKKIDYENKLEVSLKALTIPFIPESLKLFGENASLEELMDLDNDCDNLKTPQNERAEKIEINLTKRAQIKDEKIFNKSGEKETDFVVNLEKIIAKSAKSEKNLCLSEEIKMNELDFIDINKVDSFRNFKTSKKTKKINNLLEADVNGKSNGAHENFEFILVENKMLLDDRDDIINFKKRDNYMKIWDPINIKEEDLNNYIIEVEKIWPFSYYYWSEENALEFLYRNNYNLNRTMDLIKNNEEEFQIFMKKKEIIKFDSCLDNKSNEIDTRRPAKKSLRSNKTNLK